MNITYYECLYVSCFNTYKLSSEVYKAGRSMHRANKTESFKMAPSLKGMLVKCDLQSYLRFLEEIPFVLVANIYTTYFSI